MAWSVVDLISFPGKLDILQVAEIPTEDISYRQGAEAVKAISCGMNKTKNNNFTH